MAPRFPEVDRLGLGVGMDLPWGRSPGFLPIDQEGAAVAPAVTRFLRRHQAAFTSVFVSWQPRGRNQLDVVDYLPAWDSLFAELEGYPARALHHTALNLGTPGAYDRGALFELTNALVERYGLRWINEDLGVWSIAGKPLPYPMAPYLTDAGLERAIENVDECQDALVAPLLVEFPGFSMDFSLRIGTWDAYDFFRVLAERTDSAVTLDVGHLLSWRWSTGHRGEALYEELERLPLEHCFELHLSGCELSGGRFIDAHHGRLLPEQLELLRRLWPRCPNLKVVTYEDPRFDDEGRLAEATTESFEALAKEVGAWMAN